MQHFVICVFGYFGSSRWKAFIFIYIFRYFCILGGGRVEWGAGVGGEDTIYQNESDKGLFDQSTRPPGAAIRSGHLGQAAWPGGPGLGRPSRPGPATRPG